MARGKNKAIAERRNQALLEISSIESQSREIRDLKDTVKKLEAKLIEKDTAHKELTRNLNKQLEDRTSSVVEDLRDKNSKLLSMNGDLTTHVQKIQNNWQKLLLRVVDHYKEDHKMSGMEALETCMSLIPDSVDDDPEWIPTINEGVFESKGITAERLRTLQKVRGLR